MATTYPIHPATADAPLSEQHVVHTTHTLLKYIYGLLPIVAGADKFTNFICRWEDYLNPALLRLTPSVTPHQCMIMVGLIEIIAGVIVFLKPRLGAFIVMAWLLAIAGQLLLWGHHLDVAVRDTVMALGGALTLARLTPFVDGHTHVEVR